MPPATVWSICLDADRRAARDRDRDTSHRWRSTPSLSVTVKVKVTTWSSPL